MKVRVGGCREGVAEVLVRRKCLSASLLTLSFLFLLPFYSQPIYEGYWSLGSHLAPSCHPSCTKREEEEDGRFLVKTEGCRLMDMDPFHKSVTKYLKTVERLKCPQPPVQLIKGRLTWSGTNTSERGSWKTKASSCCYRTIKRVEQDPVKYNRNADSMVTTSSRCVGIPKEGLEVKEEFIKIECSNEVKVKTYQDFATQILAPEALSLLTKSKAGFWNSRPPLSPRPPNILVIGIDSISRMHMIRSLPKTRKFLLHNDFIELKGFTKIGENTFPNIMAGFGGMGAESFGSCWKDRSMKLDDCPLIWKKFGSDLKYMTGLVEDAPGIGIFNYDKTGFVRPPADYYLRPLMVANHKHHKWKEFGSSVSCLGARNPTQFLINYMEDLVRLLHNRYPYFLLSWFTSVGHDDFNTLKTEDSEFEKFISDSVARDALNNTVIMFISDHGYRFGPFRETFLGYYEESLPFFFFRLPPTLKDKFPSWYENLKVNSNRLTTPFDLYSTLVDLFLVAKEMKEGDGEREGGGTIQFNRSAPSFFQVGPRNRTCDSSRIPSRYCICGVSPDIGHESKMSRELGNCVVDRMNGELSSLIGSGICWNLTFSAFKYGREIGAGQARDDLGRLADYKDYLIALVASPGNGNFEAKVRLFHNSTPVILGDVNRISSYEGQSDCITDYRLKNYCYCRNIKAKP